ncbi:hypothetical protein BH11MYX4_BH11MYX4_37210 [soil metagenome]
MTTHFRGASRNLFILSVVSLAGMASCGLFKKKGADEADAGEDAAVAEVVDAAPPPAAAPIAANVDDVARFPDEKPIENVAATIQRTSNVREIPGVGKVVASLAKGGTVTQVAQRGTAFLVVFDNPKDQKRLMGWVGQESFTALTVDAGIKVLTCTAPEVPLVSDGPFCGRTCAADTDCPAGQACKGAANKFTNARLGDAVRVCTVFSPVPPPAASTAVPAGRGPLIPPTPPAPPVVIPIPNADISDAVGGKCPVGFTLVSKDLKCHKNCTVGQCRAASRFCTPCNGTTVCTTSLTFCK